MPIRLYPFSMYLVSRYFFVDTFEIKHFVFVSKIHLWPGICISIEDTCKSILPSTDIVDRVIILYTLLTSCHNPSVKVCPHPVSHIAIRTYHGILRQAEIINVFVGCSQFSYRRWNSCRCRRLAVRKCELRLTPPVRRRGRHQLNLALSQTLSQLTIRYDTKVHYLVRYARCDFSKSTERLKARIGLNGLSMTSPAIWDHTVLPATRHKWTRPALNPARRRVLDLSTL